MQKLIAISSLLAGVLITASTAYSQLVVTSLAFADNGMIPSKYSCEGREINPPLHVDNIPVGTKSLALIVHDPDAPVEGGMTHWVVWNIDVKGTISENYRDANQGLNGKGTRVYLGMCPPSGIHHYHFKVYALDTILKLDGDTDMNALEKAMQHHILSQGEIIGLYGKTK